MLKEKMYVRCPADVEYPGEPRVFIVGQIMEIDNFSETVKVKFHDPEHSVWSLIMLSKFPKQMTSFPISYVERCTFFEETNVQYKDHKYKVIAKKTVPNDFHIYYLQNTQTGIIVKAPESELIASFFNGHVTPSLQLEHYEFQNPVWYMGRTVTERSEHILDNSTYGFKQLAGCKIYLMPHQVYTIMRCLEADPCRYMLADEVGMGKTVEAISVLKLYTLDKGNKRILIAVPGTLKEQWRSELFFKFGLSVGTDSKNNVIVLKSINELTIADCYTHWDFLVVDEVHNYLNNDSIFHNLKRISGISENVLLLSATPVQQRKEEYLSLLRLLNPEKYDRISEEKFGDILTRENMIVKKAALVLDDLSDYQEIENVCQQNEQAVSDDEDAQDLFEEMYDKLQDICNTAEDKKLDELIGQVSIDDPDGGIYKIRVILSYICENYQIESNMIRNRRSLLKPSEEGHSLVAERRLIELHYELDHSRNQYEALTYEYLSEWIIHLSYNVPYDENRIKDLYKPLLSSFFSSAAAFCETLDTLLLKQNENIPYEVLENARKWQLWESELGEHIKEIINNPSDFYEYYSSRPVTIIEYLYENISHSKVVLFTEYEATFDYYKNVLKSMFGEERIALYGEKIDSSIAELNVYRFQNDPKCRYMLCDHTGGEGRNFQCADYVIHIDLPWDTNVIEQRIGRLDRLERDLTRPIVYSVVPHTVDTFEANLFDFWNQGLQIFEKSLSGLEIIMNDVNERTYASFKGDFRYNLANEIPEIVEIALKMRSQVKLEQMFDVAGNMFKPMYARLQKVIEQYNKNESVVFADAMLRWASLAGFHGYTDDQGNTTFPKESFSIKSAENSMLMLPDWDDYKSNKQVAFSDRILGLYEKGKAYSNQKICGTFIRKNAIENDYLHFFAPGDPIFDCIIDNALHSCKGQAACFAVLADLDWRGFIYTWSVNPDLGFLIDHGLSVHSLNAYRNYISNELVISPVAFSDYVDVSDEQVIKSYNKVINQQNKNKIEHLGQRSKSFGFMNIGFLGVSNIEWFKAMYPEEKWTGLVKESRSISKKKATKVFKKHSSISACREEMDRVLAAKQASNLYLGLENDEKEKERLNLILEAIKKPKMKLESAAFIIMKKAKQD